MDLVTSKIVALWLLPPGIFIVLVVLGLLIQLKWRWFGTILITVVMGILFALSTPQVGRKLLSSMEAGYPPLPTLTPEQAKTKADAIVVLAGGRNNGSPEYDGDTVNHDSLVRVRYAAYLHKKTGLPILVSGGSVFGEARSEADLLNDVLERDYGINAKWVERESKTTLENAMFSSKLLTEAKIRRVLLVTHAWHMPRAEWAFSESGLVPVPAPTGFTMLSEGDRGILGSTPSAHGFYLSSRALHERLGLMWYKFNGRAEQFKTVNPKQAAETN